MKFDGKTIYCSLDIETSGFDPLKEEILEVGFVLFHFVKVILDPKNQNISEDEILVASMTRPEFLPLMKKAKAFITNEGGITCHAAIVSREMNKPCIIGTKNATQIIKDGDLIEVDADVVVLGVGSGRELAIRSFMAHGIEINGISDATPVPHNGPKAKKPRRV
jgi:phosphohistidine swiveling domain-containing protein